VLKQTYRIVRPLAEGGFGRVYLAAHTRLPGRFAVKLLHRTLARDEEALARFRQEAEITSTLSHPHIVRVFDYDVTDAGVPYLVMELLEGQPLSQLVASGAPLSPRRVIPIVEQIAQALHVAHERGIVHRDLKPDNIMLLRAAGVGDFVKIFDFGISKASWRTRLTQNDTVSGTPQYMAPEQARAQREEIDHRADQFSLAALAYTLLTGREPFMGEDPVIVLYQVVHEDPPRPSELNPALGMLVDGVIARGLAKDPAHRYPGVLEFAAALRGALAEAANDHALPVRHVGRERGDGSAPTGSRDQTSHPARPPQVAQTTPGGDPGAGRRALRGRLVPPGDPGGHAGRLAQGRTESRRAVRACRISAPLANAGVTTMTSFRTGLAGLVIAGLGFSVLAAPVAQAAVIVIHGGRDEPPAPRDERVVERRGYVWERGHYGWRHHHYIWVHGHYVRERPGYEWVPGRWERHEDHYDWYRGEWHPHR
jgi:serine/threonine-protein kinase